mgnify:CR=1 FL=1|tara:strand:- start:290 stop:1060 length:771 start_codon:yes stop_codon:yes gene_type:complete
MSDSLPWFKFVADSWIAGDIQAHDMQTQGIFINICARVWKNGGPIEYNIDRLARLIRVDNDVLKAAIDDLIADDLLVLANDVLLASKFVLLQLEQRNELSTRRAEAGRKGGQAKQLNRRSKCLANTKQTPSILEVEYRTKNKSKDPPVPPAAKTTNKITIPDQLNTPEFNQAWEDWGNHRKEIKKTLTPSTTTRQLNKLLKMGAGKAIAALNNSIEKGYTAIVEPYEANGSGKPCKNAHHEIEPDAAAKWTEHLNA